MKVHYAVIVAWNTIEQIQKKAPPIDKMGASDS